MVGLAIAAGFFLLRERRIPTVDDQPDQILPAREIAEDWVVNNSPTYTFDGSDLALESEEKRAEGEYYLFVFSFTSAAAGYGDREGEMVAQVITSHTMEVIVEDGEVVSAVTDEVYDELNEEMITEVPSEEDATPETLTVSVYFVEVVEGEEQIVEVEREVPYTVATGRAAIEELLKGPLPDEEGLSTAINEGTELQSIEIEDGVARVDFNQRLDEGVAGSALVTAIRDQIERTLLQFETVDEVIISVDGRTEDILQP